MPKYILKEGVVLRPFGADSKITNENLTDPIAEMLLKKGRLKEEQLEKPTTKKPSAKK